VGVFRPQLAAQSPAVQLWPAGQTLPQLPQLLGSSDSLAQYVAFVTGQALVPAAQLSWQEPPVQSWPAAQELPQAPQFAGSVAVLVQKGLSPEGDPGQLPAVVQ
jgi:hypothetical protein